MFLIYFAHVPYFCACSVYFDSRSNSRSSPRIQNKRFGDRKNKKPNQPNRQANAEKKAAEKKDVKNEEVKTMDVDQSTR